MITPTYANTLDFYRCTFFSRSSRIWPILLVVSMSIVLTSVLTLRSVQPLRSSEQKSADRICNSSLNKIERKKESLKERKEKKLLRKKERKNGIFERKKGGEIVAK